MTQNEALEGAAAVAIHGSAFLAAGQVLADHFADGADDGAARMAFFRSSYAIGKYLQRLESFKNTAPQLFIDGTHAGGVHAECSQFLSDVDPIRMQ